MADARTTLTGQLATALDDWEGGTGDVFQAFVSRLLLACEGQESVVEQLDFIYGKYLELVDYTRKDIESIADATIKALEAGREGPSTTEVVCMIVGLVAGVSAAYLSLGTGGTVAIFSASMVNTFASASGTAAQWKVGGRDANEILASMKDEVGKLSKAARAKADILADVLFNITACIKDYADQVMPSPPTVPS